MTKINKVKKKLKTLDDDKAKKRDWTKNIDMSKDIKVAYNLFAKELSKDKMC